MCFPLESDIIIDISFSWFLMVEKTLELLPLNKVCLTDVDIGEQSLHALKM